ncbi:MAG: glycosyltransferase family 9 protein [Candidatus Chloroheliales bacterium]|nr:MAG: glycosyltransferase family 9 protein [Chloroflexota bacterium]
MSNRIRYILLWLISLLSWPWRWRLRQRLHRGGVRRVLLIRPDHLGDMLFASAALRRLRAGLVGAQIGLAVGPWSQAVAERYAPYYDALLTIPFPGFTRQAKGGWLAPYRTLWRESRKLRRWQRQHGRIDLAVNLRFDFWWGGLLCLLSGIPLLGYDTPLVRLFATIKVPYQAGQHEVEQNLTLVNFVISRWGQPVDTPPSPFFPLTEAERDWAAAWLRVGGWEGGGRLLVIHPGAGDPAKQWPTERWAAVASLLLEEPESWLLLTGSGREESLCDALIRAQPKSARQRTISAAGRTTLAELAALLDRADLVMGVDSGPLHLASTLARPTLRLFGPSDAQIWGPWPTGDPQHQVIKAARISNISVAQVAQTARAMLEVEQG